MGRQGRGRSRTRRSGSSTVTSKSTAEKLNDGIVIDRVPIVYDYESANSEDEWLEEKSKASRYSVEGQPKNQANRTKSLMSDDDEEEDDEGDEQSDMKSFDRYSHSNKQTDTCRAPTIDRLWSQSMDSDTQQFQGVAYKGSYFGGINNKKDIAKTKNASKPFEENDPNPSMMEPIYELPRRNRKKTKTPLVSQENSVVLASVDTVTKASEVNSKSQPLNKKKTIKPKFESQNVKQSEQKKKPTDEISTEVDGSTTSSLTDPLEHMLLHSNNDSNKVVQDIEKKLDLLRAMAAEVDEKQRVLKEKQNKLMKGTSTVKQKSKNESDDEFNTENLKKGHKEQKESATKKNTSSSKGRSRSRSRPKSRPSRSRSNSKSRRSSNHPSAAKLGKDRKARSASNDRSQSRTTKNSSSSSKKSGGTNHSKTPSLPVAQSEGVFSNAPTEHRKNSFTPKSKKSNEKKQTQTGSATKGKQDSSTKLKSTTKKKSSSVSRSRSRSRSQGRSRSTNNNSRSRSSRRSKSRSSSKDSKSRKSHTSKSARGRSNSQSRKSTSRNRSTSSKRKRRSKSSGDTSRSRVRDSAKTSRSRSRSRKSSKPSQSRSRSPTGSRSKSRKQPRKGSMEMGPPHAKNKKSSKFNKYLMDSDLKEESVERARYELTKEMIELLEKAKLDETRNKKMYPLANGIRQPKKRKDILSNFTNFFRKTKHEEEVVVSNPASAESIDDENENDCYDGANETSDEHVRRPRTSHRRRSLGSRLRQSRSPVSHKSWNENIPPSRDENENVKVNHIDGSNIGLRERNSQSKPLAADKSKKANDLRKVAIKRAAARKVAAAEKEGSTKQKVTNEKDEEMNSAVPETEVKKEKSIVEPENSGEGNVVASENEANDETLVTDKLKQATKKGMMKRFTVPKKHKLRNRPTKTTDISSVIKNKDGHDVVEAARSVAESESRSIPQRVTNIIEEGSPVGETTHNKTTSVEPLDTRSKTTSTTITKIPEYLVAKSNPLEMDEYSITKEISNEPGMVQCLRFYSCGRTADVLNVAIKVSDTCNGSEYIDENQYIKQKRRKAQIGGIGAGDAILQSRSMITESSNTRKSTSRAPPEVHMPTVEVILEEDPKSFMTETKEMEQNVAAERREDVESMIRSMTDSDDDESLEEAPDLRMPRVNSFILDVSKMTLHLDDDSQERLTKDAIRRGIASAEEISITSIQVPTMDISSKEDVLTPTSSEGREGIESVENDDDDDDDDCSTESGILDDDSANVDAETLSSKKSKGRVLKIFSRFRNYRANKSKFSM